MTDFTAFDRRDVLATLCIAAGALPASAGAQNRSRRPRAERAPDIVYAERAEAMRFADDLAARNVCAEEVSW